MGSQPPLYLVECIQFGLKSAAKCHRPVSFLANVRYQGHKCKIHGKSRQHATEAELTLDRGGEEMAVILTLPF